MTCFTHRMRDVFKELGMEPTPENKRRLQRELTDIVKPASENCPDVWKKTKAYIAEEGKEKMIEELRQRLSSGGRL